MSVITQYEERYMSIYEIQHSVREPGVPNNKLYFVKTSKRHIYPF